MQQTCQPERQQEPLLLQTSVLRPETWRKVALASAAALMVEELPKAEAATEENMTVVFDWKLVTTMLVMFLFVPAMALR